MGARTPGSRTTPSGAPEPHPLVARLESPLSTYYLLIGVVGALLAIGLVMVLSASTVASLKATENLNAYKQFMTQAQYAAIGIAGAFVASRLPLSFYRRIAVPLIIGAITLQAFVFTPLGVDVKGNRNWLALGPIQIQPSEFGKIAIILFAATILTAKRSLLHDWKHVVVPLVVPAAGLVIGLVLRGQDLGTSFVLVAILAGVLWAAGVSWRIFAVAGALASALVYLMVTTSSNRMSRITNWLSCSQDDAHASNELVQKCWQFAHGQIALASGGLGGRGLGASSEKYGWLPEPQNDMIFAIIGEEFGLFGTLTIIVLFALLALACYRVVLRSDDLFVRIATTGVMVWIVAQALINIGAVIGMFPIIGVPLPLVSAGGSALITTLAGLGMVISFARSEPACAKALSARPHLLTRTLSVLPARGERHRRRR